MISKILICVLAAVLLITAEPVEAQPAKKIFRIGFISPASSLTAGANFEALQQGLRALGHIEGENLVIEARWAEGSAERLSQLVTELMQLNLDVLVIGGATGALTAKNLGIKIPVVFAAVTDPLGQGIISSLARPGGNITGVSLAVGEGFSGKWVELLHETIPKTPRLAVLRNPTHPVADVFLSETQAAARVLSVRLDFFEAQDANQLASALARMENERARALILIPDPLFSSRRKRIVELVARHRMPSMFFSREFVDIGGLMSYGPSFPDSYRRAAFYVDKS